MAYCTLDDIKAMLPEDVIIRLTDDEGLSIIDESRVSESIAQADAELDSYCADRYEVPLSPVPEILRKLSVDVAIYNLYSRSVHEMPPVRAGRYRAAVRQMEGIARGLVSIGPSVAAQGGLSETNKPVNDNVFSRDRMKGF